MSRFTVCRSWNGYCLLLDDDRIAGEKPDYHEGNVFYEWTTHGTYGQVDELQAENKKLRELIKELYENAWLEYPSAFESNYLERIKAFGIEVNP